MCRLDWNPGGSLRWQRKRHHRATGGLFHKLSLKHSEALRAMTSAFNGQRAQFGLQLYQVSCRRKHVVQVGILFHFLHAEAAQTQARQLCMESTNSFIASLQESCVRSSGNWAKFGRAFYTGGSRSNVNKKIKLLREAAVETPSLSEFFHFKATESSVTAAGFPPLSSFNYLSSAEEAKSGADSAPVLIEDVEMDGDDDDEDLSGAESSDSDTDHDVCPQMASHSLSLTLSARCRIKKATRRLCRASSSAGKFLLREIFSIILVPWLCVRSLRASSLGRADSLLPKKLLRSSSLVPRKFIEVALFAIGQSTSWHILSCVTCPKGSIKRFLRSSTTKTFGESASSF